jgi:hypothetical protein
MHWNGTAWKKVASPNPGSTAASNILFGIAAPSSGAAWAVGSHFDNGPPQQTLIVRWNGTAWKAVPSPNPGSFNDLDGVAATSARTAWAVGVYNNGTAIQTLAVHCC